jgi:hypothetical protein
MAFCWLPVFALLSALASGASAAAGGQLENVDLQLILAVDVSSSMSEAEQRVQRDGYVRALRSPEITRVIRSGAMGKIAILYVEWAGPNDQHVILPWTLLGSSQDAKAFADALATKPIIRGSGTSISNLMQRAGQLFGQSRYVGQRKVIDVSGDGINNIGPPVDGIRDLLVASGVTINGLPMSVRRGDKGTFETYDRKYIEAYYENCVIGGTGSFVIAIDDLSQFRVAIRTKLVREIAGQAPAIVPASYRLVSRSPFDCLAIGQAPGR